MDTIIFEKLYAQDAISLASLKKIKEQEGKQLVSVHWELKTLLYLGVLLLSTGLGIVVYKNIDSIGHQAILAFIAIISAGCFYYCVKTKTPFLREKAVTPNAFFDYSLLMGCLTFITFIGYLQFQYQVFGYRYGLASFIPMLVLFFSAYYFDHLGVLSMAITNLAAWAGLAITPASILKENDFSSTTIILTGLLLGVVLIVAGIVSKRRNFKRHFEFTYTNFGANLLFISCLAALLTFDGIYLLWFLLLAGISYFFYLKSFAEKSFYYLLLMSVYLYIGLSYVVIRLLFFTAHGEIGSVYISLLYFIGSAIGMIVFLMRMNKKIKSL